MGLLCLGRFCTCTFRSQYILSRFLLALFHFRQMKFRPRDILLLRSFSLRTIGSLDIAVLEQFSPGLFLPKVFNSFDISILSHFGSVTTQSLQVSARDTSVLGRFCPMNFRCKNFSFPISFASWIFNPQGISVPGNFGLWLIRFRNISVLFISRLGLLYPWMFRLQSKDVLA